MGIAEASPIGGYTIPLNATIIVSTGNGKVKSYSTEFMLIPVIVFMLDSFSYKLLFTVGRIRSPFCIPMLGKGTLSQRNPSVTESAICMIYLMPGFAGKIFPLFRSQVSLYHAGKLGTGGVGGGIQLSFAGAV